MMVNKDAFELLAKAINRVLTQRISKENVSKSSLKYFKSVKSKDVVRFYEHVISCENFHSRLCSNVETALGSIKVPNRLGINGYSAIMSSMNLNNEELDHFCTLLCPSYQNAIDLEPFLVFVWMKPSMNTKSALLQRRNTI
jgi:hypothetical protein